MKIAIMSDLHLELYARLNCSLPRDAGVHATDDFYANPPQPEADFLVLAGDIHDGMLAVEWAYHSFTIPTILIGGNHEAFGHELFQIVKFNRQKALETNGQVVFLERATWEGKNSAGEQIRFIGATLWTDFQLHANRSSSMALAQEQVEDFRSIKIERGFKQRILSPSDTVRLHKATVEFLQNELSYPFEGKTAIVTHHAPSPLSIAPMHHDDSLAPAFASDLDELIHFYRPSLWIHGHVNHSIDYLIGHTRVICNPRGYFPYELNHTFNPNFVIDI